jgi:hypothetical protein
MEGVGGGRPRGTWASSRRFKVGRKSVNSLLIWLVTCPEAE